MCAYDVKENKPWMGKYSRSEFLSQLCICSCISHFVSLYNQQVFLLLPPNSPFPFSPSSPPLNLLARLLWSESQCFNPWLSRVLLKLNLFYSPLNMPPPPCSLQPSSFSINCVFSFNSVRYLIQIPNFCFFGKFLNYPVMYSKYHSDCKG